MVQMWSCLSTETNSSQRGRSMMYRTRMKMAKEERMRETVKTHREAMQSELLEGWVLEEEDIKGSHSPISDLRRPDVFILVPLFWLTDFN